MRDAQLTELINENKQLRQENQRLGLENELLRQKVDLILRRMFGRKSEQLDDAQLRLLLGDLDEPGQLAASAPAAEVEAERSPRRTSTPRKPRYPEDLPVVETVVDPDPVVGNPDAWRQIGQEVSDQLDYEPGKFQLLRTIRRTWVKRADMDAAPLTAPLPPKLLERGLLAPGLLAHILISKYADHLPLNRQQQIFRQRHGVHLPRQTLARGVELAAFWLKPIVEQMMAEQEQGGYLQIDETPVKFQSPGRGQTAQGYFWTRHVPGGDTVYHWASGRGHEHLLKLVPEDFQGVVQCDGYGAYRTMAGKRRGVRLAGCWAHVRRKFFEAHQQGEAVHLNAWILRQIRLLYAIERMLRESRAGPNLRQAVRSSQSLPILIRLKKLFDTLQRDRKHRPQSLTGKALHYALGQWEQVIHYVEDGRVQIDNNGVENAIRPTALGRKNWLFIGADEAGWRSAVIYSLIQSCRAHEVEPYAYLKDVLQRLPSMTNRQIAEITPRAWSQRQEIRLVS